MSRLDGKVCVITGAASGIGAETARLFKSEGAIAVGVDLTDGSSDVDLALACDVADEEAVRSMYAAVRAEYDRIDVLFNNAGISPPEDASVLDTDVDVWERVQAVNLTSVFFCCKHGIPHLLETGGGSVINTASFVAVMGAATSQIAYTASKGAVLAMSRELGVEFARRGVRVNALCPGPINTPLLQELFASDPGKAIGDHPSLGTVTVKAGRYGPYVTAGGVNATIPSEIEKDAITLPQAIALLDERAAKGGGKAKAAKKAKPAKAAKSAEGEDATPKKKPAAIIRRGPTLA